MRIKNTKCFILISEASKGFTLIELLVVISIIGVLIGLSFIGLFGARKGARDARRKSDLELVRSGIEIYRADCDVYPTTLTFGSGSSLVGDDSTFNCLSTNTYIAEVPNDPAAPAREYFYSSTGSSYVVCAALETDPGGDTTGCGSCGETCNLKVIEP